MPSAENCQPPRLAAAVISMIMITGLADHDPPVRVIMIKRNQ
jgi:hypothetical protein